MPSGISPNPLNPLSQIYLDQISEARLKQLEKASALSASDNPADQDKAREIRVRHDYENLKKQIGSKKKPTKPACNNEGFSDWRTDLREITSDAKVVDDNSDEEPEITEKKVKNKIKINPTFKENAEEFAKNLGGQLLEVAEVVDNDEDEDGEPDDKDERKLDMMKRKEKQLKKRMIRMKMMAINQTDGEGIIASYEPDIEGAVEYFYEEGLNEEGIDQLIEEIGIEEFVNFVDESAVDLNEERAARKASVRAKKYDVVKKEVDKADAARRKAKKGEYAPSYAKKETDVTVYDDKPSAKKKAPVKKAVVKKAPVKKSKKDYDGDGKRETPKQEHRGVRNKKITKAVAKVKKTQPKKKATKQGLGDKIRTAYKAGVKRHRKATQGARVFGKGFVAGAKKAVKFAKDVKKVVSEEELNELKTSTLRNYVNKASIDAVGRGVDAGIKGMTGPKDEMEKNMSKAYKRQRGINRAANKLASRAERREEVELDERLGGKGYKRRKDYAGRTVEGDWSDSDRGAGNKATRRAGGKVKKKSPTYQAYVLNKEGYQRDPEQSKKDRTHSKQPDPSKDGFTGIGNMSIKDIMKMNAKIKAKEAAKTKKEEVQLEDRSAFKKAISKVFKKKQEERKPQKAMDAGARLRRMKQRQEYADKVSGSVDLVPDDIRDHYEGIKEGKSYGLYKGDGKVSIPGYQKKKDALDKKKKQKVSESKDKAFDYVVAKLRKQHGKDAVITKDSPKPKPPSEAQKKKAAAERKKRQDAENKAYAARAKKAGFKSTQDYTNVVARYGSEDNYNKGKGLGT